MSEILYDHLNSLSFAGVVPQPNDFDESKAIILPVPLDRTTSYLAGTRGGPRAILEASTYMELWDEELQIDIHGVGIHTLPEMELPFGELSDAMNEIERVTGDILDHDKFLLMLGGEHSITPPAVAAAARRHPGLSVLQIDAHADLRDKYMGSPFNHACAMRRVLEHAPVTQVGIRSLSTEEARAAAGLGTRIFYDGQMRQNPLWIDEIVDTLSDRVYLTIDCDGLDPAIMPAVGTPEPGGLSWREMLALLRALFRARRVVGCDLVELCPIPGLAAPNFLCAKLVYKILTYRFAER